MMECSPLLNKHNFLLSQSFFSYLLEGHMFLAGLRNISKLQFQLLLLPRALGWWLRKQTVFKVPISAYLFPFLKNIG